MLRVHILFLFAFASYLQAESCKSTYWVDYTSNAVPEQAYEIYKKDGKSVYIAQIMFDGELIGELIEDEGSVLNPDIPLKKVLCVVNKNKLYWKKTTKDTIKNAIVDTKPVVGGLLYGHPLYIGKYVNENEESVGTIYNGVMLTSEGPKTEYSILIEMC